MPNFKRCMNRAFCIGYIPLLLASCSDDDAEERVYASACASQLSNGDIVECDVDESDSRDRREVLEQLLALDQDLPGPELPGIDSQRSVASIVDSGTIVLENGIRLRLAGIECNSEIDSYLEATFLSDDPSRVRYVTTGLERNGVHFAYIWEYYEMLDPEFGPIVSYSLINEVGLMSDWCTPVQQENHRYHQKFSAVKELY